MRSAGAGFAAVTAGPVPLTELPPAGRHDTHLLSSLRQAVLPPKSSWAGIEALARRQDPESQGGRSTQTGSFRRLKREKKIFFSGHSSP